ncbi:2-oxoacid:acceptor oxidoreductase family protein [Pseudomonadota bacterium]
MTKPSFKYPGVRTALDGNSAVIACEKESSDAAGAFPITPSTQMGEYWAEAAAQGHINISGRPLIFIEPEGEHAAAAVTAGLSMTGLRAANFSSSQGIAYMHESLYAAVGKRLTYVLNMGCRAMTKSSLNVHAGHDDYHCMDDTGFFQLFAKDAQRAADFNIVAHRIAELALNPGVVAQDGFLTTHLIESMLLPERALIEEYLGRPDDIIDTPTAAQRIIYGDTRRRVPELWDVDNPVMAGIVENQDAYMQSVAAQRPFFFDHIEALTDQAFKEFYQLTGRDYARVMSYRAEDADYLILGQGSIVPSAEVVSDHLRDTRNIKVGVIDLVMFRPFPAALLSHLLKGKKGVVILERVDQPMAADLPLIREVRTVVSKCIENSHDHVTPAFPELATYNRNQETPLLYSGCFGLGSRDLQPEGIIAAIENMLPDGARKKFFYLGIDFLHDAARTPKQEIYQQTLQDAYPHLANLALHGSENPNLMPQECITLRMHSIGGWGAITTGKNLAMSLFDLLGYHIKANPKYGSEKKGQPTTYYLSAAPEPIRINCEYFYVDVVLSPDPNVLHHTNALAGLRDEGIFIIQSDQTSSDGVWASIPPNYQKIIVNKKIRVFYLDAFKIARMEATDSDLQLRMQGIAFQGAFFAATPLMEKKGLDEARLLEAIETQLEHKFGGKGARVVQDNLRVVKRGFDELQEIIEKPLSDNAVAVAVTSEPALPIMVKPLPQSKAPATDIQRFWAQTGNFYARGMGGDNLADPFIGLGTMPATTALFRDMTGIRFEHPQWIPDNCTACGKCYTVCPDTAIPGLVNDVSQVLDTVLKQVKKQGHTVKQLPRAVGLVEAKLRTLFAEVEGKGAARGLIDDAIAQVISTSNETDRPALEQEFVWFQEALGDFQFSLTRPHYVVPEKHETGSGGLFSITINPYTCKGCGECVTVCEDDALRSVTQTDASVKQLRDEWDFWLALPNTPSRFMHISNLEERIGVLQNILLDKQAYLPLTSGDGACMGCSEKSVLHLFVATVESLMRPRVEKHLTYLNELIQRLEKHIQMQLVGEINVDDTDAITEAIARVDHNDLTLSDIAEQVEKLRGSQPIDQAWLKRVTQLVVKLKKLKWRYTEGTTGRGRVAMGMVNATGCSSVWGSTYPFNPYPFPWANHLFQDSPSMAMGLFEGHMAKMADGFKTIRLAEAALKSDEQQDEALSHFNWQDFTEEEFLLCPPVVAVGGDGAMYDIGFQNLSRAMMSGKPIKVVVLDTQVYSNTGGQACTSGFMGQVSDMAPFGKQAPGKQEIRKEIALIAMAHRNTYVMQSTIAHPNHMIDGFIEGLQARRPALFNCYTSCQPEHGIGDDMGHHQAKQAVESRAYPLFRYNPAKGNTTQACFELTGNPDLKQLWPTYTLRYLDNGREKKMELPLTFADFAATEGRFRKHFRSAPVDTWHDNMVPIAEFLELSDDAREDKYPYIWTLDRKQALNRLLVSKTLVASCEDRKHFWIMLKSLAGIADTTETPEDIESNIRQDVIAKIAAGLAKMAGGDSSDIALTQFDCSESPKATAETTEVDNESMAPWLESEECTSCGECISINPAIFTYDENEKAHIKDAKAGPYADLVTAAERCTAQVIHPGLPRTRTEKEIEKWIARASKFNH